jgi:hypothetical protein
MLCDWMGSGHIGWKRIRPYLPYQQLIPHLLLVVPIASLHNTPQNRLFFRFAEPSWPKI